MRKLFILIGLALEVFSSFGASAQAGPEDAAATYRRPCSKGDADSCFKLGVAYETGRGAEKSMAVAVVLYKRACDRSHRDGCYSLGVGYYTGNGIRINKRLAEAAFAKSCSLGRSVACTNAGNMNFDGEGVPQNLTRAVELYRLGCEGNDGGSCFNLAMRYRLGEGVREDVTQSATLYEKSCELRFRRACEQLAVIRPKTQELDRISPRTPIASASASSLPAARDVGVPAPKVTPQRPVARRSSISRAPKLGDRRIVGMTCEKYVWQELPNGKRQTIWSGFILGEARGLVGNCEDAINLQDFYDSQPIRKIPDFQKTFDAIQSKKAYWYGGEYLPYNFQLTCRNGRTMRIYVNGVVEDHRQSLRNFESRFCIVDPDVRYQGALGAALNE